jgi:hypothetical protein
MPRKKTETDIKAVMDAISGLSLTDRCLALTLSIIEVNHTALGPIFGLANVIGRMCQDMNATQRMTAANELRNVADRIEVLGVSQSIPN